jgi:hypothetical protein
LSSSYSAAALKGVILVLAVLAALLMFKVGLDRNVKKKVHHTPVIHGESWRYGFRIAKRRGVDQAITQGDASARCQHIPSSGKNASQVFFGCMAESGWQN